MMAQDLRPNWRIWEHIPVTILEAVALSMTIDPKHVTRGRIANLPPLSQGYLIIAGLPAPPEFLERYWVALENNQNFTLVSKEGSQTQWRYSLGAIAAKALHVWHWEMPPEMVALAPNHLEQAGSEIALGNRWPWGTRQTKLLGQLAAAAEAFWSHYDPADPSTAPTNIQVIDWLVKRTVAKRVAQIMAQILRVDELPAGNRKR